MSDEREDRPGGAGEPGKPAGVGGKGGEGGPGGAGGAGAVGNGGLLGHLMRACPTWAERIILIIGATSASALLFFYVSHHGHL